MERLHRSPSATAVSSLPRKEHPHADAVCGWSAWKMLLPRGSTIARPGVEMTKYPWMCPSQLTPASVALDSGTSRSRTLLACPKLEMGHPFTGLTGRCRRAAPCPPCAACATASLLDLSSGVSFGATTALGVLQALETTDAEEEESGGFFYMLMAP